MGQLILYPFFVNSLSGIFFFSFIYSSLFKIKELFLYEKLVYFSNQKKHESIPLFPDSIFFSSNHALKVYMLHNKVLHQCLLFIWMN